MNTTTLNPWSILDEMLSANGRAFGRLRARAAGKYPSMNAFVDDHAILIDFELPGKTAKDVELMLEPQAVTVADRPEPKADSESGKPLAAPPAWSRRIALPFRVNAEKASAKFTDGILRVSLPKAEEANLRHLAIAG